MIENQRCFNSLNINQFNLDMNCEKYLFLFTDFLHIF